MARPGRTTLLAAAAAAIALLAAAAIALTSGSGGDRLDLERLSAARLAGPSDPFDFDPDRAQELLVRAGAAYSHVLYELSPGGVERSARRVERLEPALTEAADREGVDPETLAAVIFLESAGRPDALAGPTPESATGLGQILPGTGTDLLGMSVDLERSTELTSAIARARRRASRARGGGARRAARQARRLEARRRSVDERFDPPAALAGAARYLRIAEDRFGREDLAVASYHMGIGNLESVIADYVSPRRPRASTRATVAAYDISYPRLFFDSTPVRNPATYRRLTGLGDDSRTYLFRVEAAREILRLHREDPERLARLDALHARKASSEDVLRPAGATAVFAGPDDVRDAYDDGELVPLPVDPGRLGYTVDPGMGELAPRVDERPELYRGLRPEALATVAYIAGELRAIAGDRTTLTLTSTVRDERYQSLLAAENPEASAAYSLHTTGYAFDVGRDLPRARERALVAVLDRLRALRVIEWVEEPAAFHVTVGPGAEELLAAL